jgi:hypothetical protein
VVDRSALSAAGPNGARGPLRWFAAALWFELILAIVPVVWLGNFAAGAVHAPIVFGSAVVLDVFAILLLVNVAMQVATLYTIQYDGAVTKVQSALERLRVLRLRAARGIFASAVFAWLPLCLVGLAALFGNDVVRMLDIKWVVANLLVGVAFVPFAVWLCRLFETRAELHAAGRIVAGTVSGSRLNAALASMERIEAFRNVASSI